jgi:urease subunit gamma/beta
VLLTPHEQERLMLSYAADLAWRRRERGLRLNYPESVAILCAFVLEAARDGRSVSELMQAGREVLSTDDVMDGVPAMLPEVQIEATFPDGTKLVTIHDPFRVSGESAVTPGEVIAAEGVIALNADAPRTVVRVVNTGDRPVQVGSHFHLAQANAALDLDRQAAWGKRLDIPAGTAVRFEPGIARDVTLVPIAGARLVPGLSLDSPGALDAVDDAPAPATED